MMNAKVVIPFPVAPTTLTRGGLERLSFNERVLKFKVPPGVSYGTYLRIQGRAGIIDEAHQNSDLFLVLQKQLELKPPRDIVVPAPFTPTMLRKGGIQRISFRGTNIDVRIPSNVPSGKRILLRGMASLVDSENQDGDLYMLVQPTQNRLFSYFGIFDGFGEISKRRVALKIKLPFFEFTDEFTFREKTGVIDVRY